MHADRASRFDAPPPPSALLRQAMQEGLVPLTADAATKSRRELFVGNTPANTTERGLADHLNAALRAAGFCTAPGAPVISCRVSAAYAFVELRSVQETDNCLSLTGLPFLGGALKIGRPTKYDGPRTVASSWARVAQTIDAASLAERKSNFAVRRHGCIMIPRPSTRRLLDGAPARVSRRATQPARPAPSPRSDWMENARVCAPGSALDVRAGLWTRRRGPSSRSAAPTSAPRPRRPLARS